MEEYEECYRCKPSIHIYYDALNPERDIEDIINDNNEPIKIIARTEVIY